ncbi:TcfC E-set like domain-containing protein [Tsuneonella sp. HG249]
MCFSALASGVLAAPAQAKDADTVISIAEPAGFETLSRTQDMLVDVYFGGVRIGETRILAQPGSVTFVDPDKVFALLPKVTDPTKVVAVLATPGLPANSNLVCGQTGNPVECGRLSPDVAGVILDRSAFRVDVFVNPRFLDADSQNETFLEASSDGLTMMNTFGAVFSGQSGPGLDYHAVQNAFIVGSGDKRVRSTLTYATGQGFEVPELTLEWDQPGVRYLAGALRAPGGDFGGRNRVVGLGIQSQIDTRLDRDELIGSPLIAFLDRRSRVDVLVDGRVVHSAIYEAGNQRIETSSLPYGSYDIVLRVQEPAGPAREERRLFSKNLRVPSMGRTDFYAFGGMLTKDGSQSALAPSGQTYVQAAVAHRLSDRWALEGIAQSVDWDLSAQLGAIFLASFASFRAAAFIDGSGNTGGLFQVTSSGVSPLNFNFDVRRFSGALARSTSPLTLGSNSALGTDEYAQRNYTQASGVISYAHANLRLLGTLALRQAEGEGLRYSIGPSIEWDVLRKGPLSVALRSEVTATDQGQAAFAGLAVRFAGARTQFSSSGGARHSSIAGDSRGSGYQSAFQGGLTAALGQSELALGAGYERQPSERNAILSADLRHPLASVVGDFVRNDTGASASNQYSVGLQSTLIAGAGVATLAGRTTSESVVVAQLRGATEQDRFEVLVNDQVAGEVAGEGLLKLALPAYRQYDLRIRSVGGSLVSYDSASRRVVLYPGSVTKLDWTTTPVSILFGQLLTPEGQPVAHASITGDAAWAETDDNGYFQIETSLGSDLTVATAGGATFPLSIPLIDATEKVVRLGAVSCCGQPGTTHTALEVAKLSVVGDHR